MAIGGYPMGAWVAALTFLACAAAYETRRAGPAKKHNLKIVSTNRAASPGLGHYSQGIIHGDRLYVSGLLPITPQGEKLGDRPFNEQVTQVLNNLKAILESADTDITGLVSVRIYITDIEQWGQFNTIYAAFLGDHKPARAVVPVPVLNYGAALELEAVAAID